MNAKDKIIVLRTHKHGESDIIVHGLNTQGARMSFFARGGMKSRKRFAGGILEPLHYIEVTYKVGQSHDSDPLHTLLEAQMVREFTKLRTDYGRLEAALYMVKLVNKIGQAGVMDSPELFNLLGNALAAAETTGNLDKLKLHFELKVMATQGVLPHEEGFENWLHAPLAKHEQIPAEREDLMLIHTQVHEHLRHYIGII